MLTVATFPKSLVTSILLLEPAKSRLEHCPVLVSSLLLPLIAASPTQASFVFDSKIMKGARLPETWATVGLDGMVPQ